MISLPCHESRADLFWKKADQLTAVASVPYLNVAPHRLLEIVKDIFNAPKYPEHVNHQFFGKQKVELGCDLSVVMQSCFVVSYRDHGKEYCMGNWD